MMNKKQTESTKILTKKDRHHAALRYMFMGVNNFNYETQQGPAVVFSLNKALRKIYTNDDEYIASLNNHFEYFNTTTAMANIIFVLAQTEEVIGYIWYGCTMNSLYNLHNDNQYPDDLPFLCFDRKSFNGSGNLNVFKMMVGARWLDDIVANNAVRERM